MLASENSLVLFHQTNGLMSCDWPWQKSSLLLMPMTKPAEDCWDVFLACSFSPLRTKLPYFLNYMLSKNYNSANSLSQFLYITDTACLAWCAPRRHTITKRPYDVLDLCQLLSFILAPWGGDPPVRNSNFCPCYITLFVEWKQWSKTGAPKPLRQPSDLWERD